VRNPNPLVSVIIPTRNRANLLSRALGSVFAQTYDKLECIVVDDGSEDETQEILAAYTDPRLVVLKHKTNRYASAARNTGIAQSSGEFIAFLDDDDAWLPKKLERQVPLLSRSPEAVGMVYCWMDYFDERGALIKRHDPRLKGYVFPYILDAQRLGGCPTLLVRREVVAAVGGFDESLLRGNDGDFVRRVCREYEVDFVPEVLVRVYIGHGSQRISACDDKGIRNHINAQITRLEKFADAFRKHPKEKANIYIDISLYYSRLRDLRKAMVFWWKAFKTSPLSTKAHVGLLRILKAATGPSRETDQSND